MLQQILIMVTEPKKQLKHPEERHPSINYIQRGLILKGDCCRGEFVLSIFDDFGFGDF